MRDADLQRVLRAGSQLSNIAYNLAQQAGKPLPKDAALSMDRCRREWDEAVRAMRAAEPRS